MADNFILITNLICYGAVVFAIYSFIKKKRVNDEEEKNRWGKYAKISLVVFVVALGAQFLEPENMKVKRETELAALQAARDAQEEKNAKVKAEQEAREVKEKAEREAKEKEEAALQKKYDDQAKYEEWIAWKKQEAEKQAQKANEERKAQEEQRRKEQERRRQEENKYQVINISALLNEIRSNAARAKHNFNGKYLKMEGIVLTIESDGDNIVISDGEYNLIPAVHCMPSRNNNTVREKIFRLNKGQYVTVYGKVTNIGETIGCYFELEKIQ